MIISGHIDSLLLAIIKKECSRLYCIPIIVTHLKLALVRKVFKGTWNCFHTICYAMTQLHIFFYLLITNHLYGNISGQSRKVKIAALLVEHGIKMCKKEYAYMFQDIPDIVKLTSNQLDGATKICNDISYKSMTTSLEKEALEKDRVFLFNWNKILDRGKNRFDNFISKLIHEPIKTTNLKYSKNKLTIIGGLEGYEKRSVPNFEIRLYPYEHKVSLIIQNLFVTKDDLPKKGSVIEKDGQLKSKRMFE